MKEDLVFIVSFYKEILFGPGPILSKRQLLALKLVVLWMFMFSLDIKRII